MEFIEDEETTITAESFLRSLAEQLAHQRHAKVKDFEIIKEPKTKDETA